MWLHGEREGGMRWGGRAGSRVPLEGGGDPKGVQQGPRVVSFTF